MTFTKKEFETALATIPEASLTEQNWLGRVNSWEKVKKEGALQAAYLRRWSVYADMRSVAPEFYDWLLSVFPASEDQSVLDAHAARRPPLYEQA